MSLIGSGLFFEFVQMKSHANVAIGALLAGYSVLCFLGRFSLKLDLQAGRVTDTSGFWPFSKTRSASLVDFSNLEIIYIPSGKSGHYTLLLVGNDGRKVSLCNWTTWPKLNNLAQELSGVTGWPVNDQSKGSDSFAAFLSN